MADREHFLKAIRANPADDTVRLVYADWLEEQQNELDDMRAKLIRLGARWPASTHERDRCVVPDCCKVVPRSAKTGEDISDVGIYLDAHWKHEETCPERPGESHHPDVNEACENAHEEIDDLGEQLWKKLTGFRVHYYDLFQVYMDRGFFDSGAECPLDHWCKYGDYLKDDFIATKVRVFNLRLEGNRMKDWRVLDSGMIRFFADTDPFKKGDTFTITEFRERLHDRWPWVSEFIFDESPEKLITKAQAERELEEEAQAESDQFWFGVPDDVFN